MGSTSVGEMENAKRLARVQAALSVAEDALREIASPDCGWVEDAGDGHPAIDTGAPYRIAQGALRRIEGVWS